MESTEVATQSSRSQFLIQGDPRPHLNLELGPSQYLRALVDTGAQISCISESDFFKLNEPLLVPKRKLSPIKGVSGSRLEVIGSVSVPFKIGSLFSNCEFSVVKNFHTRPILGCDWLASHNVKIGCSPQGNFVESIDNQALEGVSSVGILSVANGNVNKQRDICANKNMSACSKRHELGAHTIFQGKGRFKMWKSDLHEEISSLTNTVENDKLKFFAYCSEQCLVEPLTVKKIRVHIKNENNFEPDNFQGVIDNFPKLINNLYVVPARISLTDGAATYVYVANTDTVSKTLKRHAKVGSYESMDLLLSQELSSSYLESLKSVHPPQVETVSQGSTHPVPQEKFDLISQCLLKTNLTGDKLGKLKNLLLEYSDIIAQDAYDIGKAKYFQHKILPKSEQPIYRKQFRIADCHQQFVNEYVSELLKMGVIQESFSPYNAPIFVVKKKAAEDAKLTQKFRLVQDLRELNSNVFEDRYSIREVDSCIAEIGKSKSKIFTAIDLVSSFWQLPLHTSSRPLTAFTVPGRGHFEWTRAPMGLNSSPAGFSRVIDCVFKGLKHTVCYLDDIMCHSPDFYSHLRDLHECFGRIRYHGFKINIVKSSFCAEETNYLGFRLTKEGVLPSKDKSLAIKEFPEPSDIKSVRSFIGLVNYFRGHIPHFTQLSGHLTALLRKDASWKSGPLPDRAKQAFEVLKTALSSDPIMAYPMADCQFILTTDAATGTDEIVGGFGAVLSQIQEGSERIIAYASRTLRKHEKNYSPFLAEMAASVYGIEEFSHFLRGRKFILRTDHKPLESLSKMHKKTLSRLGEVMNEYNFVVEYLPGQSNVVADCLSRNPLFVDALAMDNEEMACAQLADILLCQVFKYIKFQKLPDERSQAERVKLLASKAILDDGVLYMYNKVHNVKVLVLCVPKTLQREVIKAYHTHQLTGHKSFDKTLNCIQMKYFWPSMTNDIQAFCKACVSCQLSKTSNTHKQKVPLQLPEIPDQPNFRIHSDLFGPLKSLEGDKKYIMTLTDSFSKMVELVALPDKSAPTIAKAFFERWICRYGAPLQFVSDQGREFTNSVLQALCDLMNIEKSRTSGYCPQSNGQAEVFNKEIRKYLTCFLENRTLEWEDLLPPLAFSYNVCINKATAQSPFFLTYLHQANLPFDLLNPKPLYSRNYAVEAFRNLQDCYRKVLEHNATYREGLKRYFDIRSRQKIFEEGEQVLVYFPPRVLQGNPKFIRPWKGPFYVSKVLGHTNVEVKKSLSEKTGNVVHLNRVKPFIQGEEYNDADLFFSGNKAKGQLFLPEQIHDNLRDSLESDRPSGKVRQSEEHSRQLLKLGPSLSYSSPKYEAKDYVSSQSIPTQNKSAVGTHFEAQDDDIDEDVETHSDIDPEVVESDDESEITFHPRKVRNKNLQGDSQESRRKEDNSQDLGPAFRTRYKNPQVLIDISTPRVPIERKQASSTSGKTGIT